MKKILSLSFLLAAALAALAQNVGIGTTTPQASLDIFQGRLRFTGNISGSAAQGIEFTNAAGTATNGFIGVYNDSVMGCYGFTGAGWNVAFNNTSGKVGIGTMNPTEKLHVNGSMKITDGTQGNGKVLTSDANGKAEWKQIIRKDTLSISPLATTGNGNTCVTGPLIAYFPTPVTGGQFITPVYLPTGATVTQIMVYYVDFSVVKDYTISFNQMPQGIPFPSPLATFTTGGTPSTAIQNAPLSIPTPITINNSNNFYFITMTGDFQTPSEGFCGARIAYTYPVNN